MSFKIVLTNKETDRLIHLYILETQCLQGCYAYDCHKLYLLFILEIMETCQKRPQLRIIRYAKGRVNA